MNPPKCDRALYTRFLLVSQQRFSCAELSRVAPEPVSHGAVSRFLWEEDSSPKDLWRSVKSLVSPGGVLIVDDTVLPKPWSTKNHLVHRLWSNVEKRVVKGMGLTTLLWTATGEHLPIDYRVYAYTLDRKTKLDHAEEMLSLGEGERDVSHPRPHGRGVYEALHAQSHSWARLALGGHL